MPACLLEQKYSEYCRSTSSYYVEYNKACTCLDPSGLNLSCATYKIVWIALQPDLTTPYKQLPYYSLSHVHSCCCFMCTDLPACVCLDWSERKHHQICFNILHICHSLGLHSLSLLLFNQVHSWYSESGALTIQYIAPKTHLKLKSSQIPFAHNLILSCLII